MENFLDELELPKIDDIKFELDEWLSEESAEIPHSKGSEEPNRKVQVKKTVNRHAMRRVLSELALEKFKSVDVDALTYMRVIVSIIRRTL